MHVFSPTFPIPSFCLCYFHSLSPALFLPPSCAIGCTALPLLLLLLLSDSLSLSCHCTLVGLKPPLFSQFHSGKRRRDKDRTKARRYSRQTVRERGIKRGTVCVGNDQRDGKPIRKGERHASLLALYTAGPRRTLSGPGKQSEGSRL